MKAAAESDLSESDIPSENKSNMVDMVRTIHAHTLPFKFEYLTKVKNEGMIEARIKALNYQNFTPHIGLPPFRIK